MKTQLAVLAICILMLVGLAVSADAQQKDKDKGHQKEQKQNKGNQGKGQDKASDAKADFPSNKKDQAEHGNQGKKDEKANANANAGKSTVHGNEGSDGNKGKNADLDSDDFKWDRETFKDRDKIRKADKVTICHKVDRENDPGVTIKVSSNALQAHLKHGDVQGSCPDVKNNVFSNDFLSKRNDYYNVLEENREQVLYSRSILDYARERLTQARLQLNQMQTGNVAPAQVETKRVAVVELEQNVSLLEALLSEVTRAAVNKLL
jgi:hypothetical protein